MILGVTYSCGDILGAAFLGRFMEAILWVYLEITLGDTLCICVNGYARTDVTRFFRC